MIYLVPQNIFAFVIESYKRERILTRRPLSHRATRHRPPAGGGGGADCVTMTSEVQFWIGVSFSASQCIHYWCGYISYNLISQKLVENVLDVSG